MGYLDYILETPPPPTKKELYRIAKKYQRLQKIKEIHKKRLDKAKKKD